MAERIFNNDNLHRVKMATMFFDDEILPAIAEGKDIDIVAFEQMRRSYQDSHPIVGNDFGIEHVWGAAFKRSALYSLERGTSLENTRTADLVERACVLLTNLQLEGLPPYES